MQVANIHQAKTQLSRLIELALQGEEVVIAKAGKYVAKLVPFSAPKKKRVSGMWKGKIEISDDFDDELPEEIMKYFKP